MTTRQGRTGWAVLPDEDTWDAPARLSEREGRTAAGEDWRWTRRAPDDDEGEME